MSRPGSAEAPLRSADIPVCGFGGVSSPSPIPGTRNSPEPAGWKTCAPVLLLLLWLVIPEVVFALSTNKPPAKIPPLRPPAELLGPTWWERRGSQVVIVGVVLLAGLGLAAWWLCRPRPIVPVAPDAEARRALETLRGRAEDETVVTAVARNLRRFVQAVLGLPADEWTADELLQAVRSHPPAGPELAQAVGLILRECETRAFAPVTPPPLPALVERALGVVAQFEALRVPLSPAPPPITAQANPPAPPVATPSGDNPPQRGISSGS